MDVRLVSERLVAKVTCKGPEVFDHEVNLWLFVSKADQPLFIKSWRAHDLVVDRPEK